MQGKVTNLTLNDGYSAAIIHVVKGIEIIVWKDGIKQACRTERRNILERFLMEEEVHIFKGRVQLFKSGREVFILLKGEIAGSISDADFKKAIATI